MTITKTILITGSTDGVGLEAAKVLAAQNHNVLLHGRSESKLLEAERHLVAQGGSGDVERFEADLSSIDDVVALAASVASRHDSLDALVNNAGVFRLVNPVGDNGLDLRFMVNVIAPYVLTRHLASLLGQHGRVVNLSSAAQAPVDPDALTGSRLLDDGEAYAQSKLALTMWSNHLAAEFGSDGPAVVAINPGSFLGTKMVKEAYGTEGKDIGIGADIVARAATSDEFGAASGRYYDNDAGRFAHPHPDALDERKNEAIVGLVEATIAALGA